MTNLFPFNISPTLDDMETDCSMSGPADNVFTCHQVDEVKARLNEYLSLARAYGWTEYMEEITELTAEMHRLSQYTRDRA